MRNLAEVLLVELEVHLAEGLVEEAEDEVGHGDQHDAEQADDGQQARPDDRQAAAPQLRAPEHETAEGGEHAGQQDAG